MTLVVLYDAHCAVCVRCRSFVESSETLVRVRFLDCRSGEARTRYGEIPFLVHSLVVVDDAGRALERRFDEAQHRVRDAVRP